MFAWIIRVHHECMYSYVYSLQYVRTPITCWVPVHFTGSQTKFANQYCWIKNTYYQPWNDELPDNDKQQMISYYQWIPFILLTQVSVPCTGILYYCMVRIIKFG